MVLIWGHKRREDLLKEEALDEAQLGFDIWKKYSEKGRMKTRAGKVLKSKSCGRWHVVK